jgi:hypothetical protein
MTAPSVGVRRSVNLGPTSGPQRLQACVLTDLRPGTRYAISQGMLSLRLFVLSGLTFGALGGCTDDGVGIIDYERTGGFAGVRLSLHVESDGEATRRRFDGVTETFQLDPAKLADLDRQVREAKFSTLEAMYSCDCADDFLHTISVHVDGAAYTVMADDTAEYPDRLRPLVETLVSMTDVFVID